MRLRAFAACFAIPCFRWPRLRPRGRHTLFGVEYDANKWVTLTGRGSPSIEWTNPHSFLYIDVKGTKVNQLEIRWPPSRRSLQNWMEARFDSTGETITIFGWQARNGGTRRIRRPSPFKILQETSTLVSGGGGPAPQVAVPPPSNSVLVLRRNNLAIVAVAAVLIFTREASRRSKAPCAKLGHADILVEITPLPARICLSAAR